MRDRVNIDLANLASGRRLRRIGLLSCAGEKLNQATEPTLIDPAKASIPVINSTPPAEIRP